MRHKLLEAIEHFRPFAVTLHHTIGRLILFLQVCTSSCQGLHHVPQWCCQIPQHHYEYQWSLDTSKWFGQLFIRNTSCLILRQEGFFKNLYWPLWVLKVVKSHHTWSRWMLLNLFLFLTCWRFWICQVVCNFFWYQGLVFLSYSCSVKVPRMQADPEEPVGLCWGMPVCEENQRWGS